MPNFTPSPRLTHYAALIYPTLTVVFGLQLLRLTFPYLRYGLYGYLHWTPTSMVVTGLGLAATVWLIPWLNRLVSLPQLLWLSVGGVGLSRLGLQLWTGNSVVDMVLVFGGLMCWGWFWPTYWAVSRSRTAPLQVAQVWLLGSLLDTTLHGVFMTYDYAWQPTWLALLLATSLTLLQLSTFALIYPTLPTIAHEGDWRDSISLLAWGLVLYLQVMILQNIANFTRLTGWALPLAFAWILGSQLIGLACISWGRLPRPVVIVSLTLGLAVGLGGLVQWPAWGVAVVILLGQVTLAVCLMALVGDGETAPTKVGLGGIMLNYGIGWVLCHGLVWGYYIVYLIALPYSSNAVLSLAALIIGLITWFTRPKQLEVTANWRMVGFACLTLIAPLTLWGGWQSPQLLPLPNRTTARVMTYNIQNGFNIYGQLDMEGLWQVIAAQQPDILALQEVSRGSLLDGSLDMQTWLEQRLRLPSVMATTAAGYSGQTTFSRYPIRQPEGHMLPPANITNQRSFSYLQLQIGADQFLNVINTHYTPYSKAAREAHSQAIVDFLQAKKLQHVIMMGDLNSIPERPAIELLITAGLQDVIQQSGLRPGYTASMPNPAARIDYILISKELTATQVIIPYSPASDHLSVAATVSW